MNVSTIGEYLNGCSVKAFLKEIGISYDKVDHTDDNFAYSHNQLNMAAQFHS